MPTRSRELQGELEILDRIHDLARLSIAPRADETVEGIPYDVSSFRVVGQAGTLSQQSQHGPVKRDSLSAADLSDLPLQVGVETSDRKLFDHSNLNVSQEERVNFDSLRLIIPSHASPVNR